MKKLNEHYYLGWYVSPWRKGSADLASDTLVLLGRQGTICWADEWKEPHWPQSAIELREWLLALTGLDDFSKNVPITICVDAPLGMPKNVWDLYENEQEKKVFRFWLDPLFESILEEERYYDLIYRKTELHIIRQYALDMIPCYCDANQQELSAKASYFRRKWGLKEWAFEDGNSAGYFENQEAGLRMIETQPLLTKFRRWRMMDELRSNLQDAYSLAKMAQLFEEDRGQLIGPVQMGIPLGEGWLWHGKELLFNPLVEKD